MKSITKKAEIFKCFIAILITTHMPPIFIHIVRQTRQSVAARLHIYSLQCKLHL